MTCFQSRDLPARVTRKIVPLASSLTSSAPSGVTATPAGRPQALSLSSTRHEVRAVQRDEGVAAVFGRERRVVVERGAQRGGVRLDQHLGRPHRPLRSGRLPRKAGSSRSP
jgi:hypothetical protein